MNNKFTSQKEKSKDKEPIGRVSMSDESKSNQQTIIIFGIVTLMVLSAVGFFILTRGDSQEDFNEQQETTITTEESKEKEEQEDEEEIALDEQIDVSEKESDSDATAAPLDEYFSTQDQQVGNKEVEEGKLTNITTEGYESFFRIEFTFEGEVPLFESSFSAQSNSILVKVSGLAQDTSGIAAGTGSEVTGSIVSTVFKNVKGETGVSYYSVGIKEETSFYLHKPANSSKVILDVKEKETDYTPSSEEEFAFSKGSQTIEGNSQGNVIKIEAISYSSHSGYFRIIFRLVSNGGGTIPAANASIVDYQGGKAVKLEISELYTDYLAPYDAEYNNAAVESMSGTFLNNKSTYYIKLNGGARDYKLHYLTAPAQLMVDVK